MSPFILALFSTILIFNEALTSSGQPLGMEEYYNIIDPKNPKMMAPISEKTRDKLNLKTLIRTINQLNAKQKYWGKSTEQEDSSTLEEFSSTTTTTERPTEKEIIITINEEKKENLFPIERSHFPSQPIHDYNPPRIANLHEQSEVEQKRYFHSAIDGWMF